MHGSKDPWNYNPLHCLLLTPIFFAKLEQWGCFQQYSVFLIPAVCQPSPHTVLYQLLNPFFSISLPLHYCVCKLHQCFSSFSLISQVEVNKYANLKPSLLSQELLGCIYMLRFFPSLRIFQVDTWQTSPPEATSALMQPHSLVF